MKRWLAILWLSGATRADMTCDEPEARPHQPAELISLRPRAYRLRQLLSGAECAELISLGADRLSASQVGVSDADSQAGWRNSSTMLFDSAADASEPLLRRLRRRIVDAALMDERNAEPLQLARYGPDDVYSLHLDFDGAGAVPRIATLIVFLSDDFDGGETVFPRVGVGGTGGGAAPMRPLSKLLAAGGEALLMSELGKLSKYCDAASPVLRVRPVRGDALLFFSFGSDLQPDHDSVHGGCPPRGGSKWIAQQWFTVDTQQAAPRTRGRGAAAAAGDVDDGTAVPEARGSEQQAKQQSARALERLRMELSGGGG